MLSMIIRLCIKIYHFIFRFCRGIRAITFRNRLRLIPVIICGIAWGLLFYYTNHLLNTYPIIERVVNRGMLILCGLFFIWLIWKLGVPIFAQLYNRELDLWRDEDAPKVIDFYRPDKNSRDKVYVIDNPGIPAEKWRAEEERIGTRLKCFLTKPIDYGKTLKGGVDMGRIVLHTFPARKAIFKKMNWSDKYISQDDFVLVMGMGVTGQLVTINLLITPHSLLGGASQSGKSLLLACLLMQAYKKGARIIIADFKVFSYPKIWRDKCEHIAHLNDFENLLDGIISEYEQRQKTLLESDCTNISEYNKHAIQVGLPTMQRIVIAVDEVADVFLSTKSSTALKDRIARVEHCMERIAMQGAAAGINLILSTQRPSSDCLSGQIRSNIDTKAVGRSDVILAKMVTDKPDAAHKIPKDAQGRFMTNSDVIFQSFYFDMRKAFDEMP